MPQITVTLSESDYELLQLITKETKRSQSSVAAQCINTGLYVELEKLNKAEMYKEMIAKRKTKTTEDSEN